MELVVERVTKRYGQVVAVNEISLTAKQGEFVVLLGPSGCGKTTLLRMIAGLDTPDSGAIRIGGVDITHREPRDRDLAMVFQSYALYPHMTVAENIAYPLKVRKRAAAQIETEVGHVSKKLGLDGLLARRPRELSGGQRQRVALARAIVRRPKAFLMDEPLSNLDAQLRLAMRAELKHLQHELGVATLYVTHDQAEAMTLAQRIAVICDGRIQQYDTPSNIYHRPANRFVAGFLGSPPMNLLTGQVEGGWFECSGVRIPLGPERLSALGSRRRVTLGARPEDLEVALASHPGWTQARVYVCEDMGNETFLRLVCGETHLVARVTKEVAVEFDAPAWFHLSPARAHLFDAESGERIC
jgi:multiple sugar transport system ATP-binding protein